MAKEDNIEFDGEVVDTLPNGQCPIGPVNYDSSDPGGECAAIFRPPVLSPVRQGPHLESDHGI